MDRQLSHTDTLEHTLRDARPQTEEQRRALLHGRRILIVMGSYPGKRPVYERARELGLNLVVLDGPGHWTQAAVGEGLFEQFIEVDLHEDGTLFERAMRAVQAAGLRFDGVATFEEFAGVLAAQLAHALQLPGHAPDVIAVARDKYLVRQACMRASIPTPRFAHITTRADLKAAADHVGFPAILKPISGAASVGTHKVEDAQALQMRYDQIIAPLNGHLKTTGIHSDDEQELVWATGIDMVLEEYLDGEEFDVDCLLSEGQIVYAGVTHDWPQPHCKEVGAEIPPLFPSDQQREMVELAERMLHVMGFKDGVFHVEVKYTSAGPRLIEINARMGGGPRYRMNKLVWGVDLVEQYLMTTLGLRIRPQPVAEPLASLAQYLFPVPHGGRIAHTQFLDRIARHPQVVQCHTFVEAGQRVIGPEDGPPDWLGEIMVQGTSSEAAIQLLETLLKEVTLPIITDGQVGKDEPRRPCA